MKNKPLYVLLSPCSFFSFLTVFSHDRRGWPPNGSDEGYGFRNSDFRAPSPRNDIASHSDSAIQNWMASPKLRHPRTTRRRRRSAASYRPSCAGQSRSGSLSWSLACPTGSLPELLVRNARAASWQQTCLMSPTVLARLLADTNHRLSLPGEASSANSRAGLPLAA